jgi:DNA mismatch endonuclease, patch repair protein
VRADEYPHPTSAGVVSVMKANRSTDTRPEVRLRSALHRLGLRFRKDFRVQLPERSVRVDIAFTRQRLACFLDGCYWHACPEHGHAPKVNTQYWGPKLARNVERDRKVTAALQSAGWTVLRIWEHVPTDEAVREVKAALAK